MVLSCSELSQNKMSQVLSEGLTHGEEAPPGHWRISHSCGIPPPQVISVFLCTSLWALTFYLLTRLKLKDFDWMSLFCVSSLTDASAESTWHQHDRKQCQKTKVFLLWHWCLTCSVPDCCWSSFSQRSGIRQEVHRLCNFLSHYLSRLKKM